MAAKAVVRDVARVQGKPYGLADKLWIVGGSIPRNDLDELKKLGVHGVFPFGTPLQSIVDFINERMT